MVYPLLWSGLFLLGRKALPPRPKFRSPQRLLSLVTLLIGLSGCFPLPSFGQVKMPSCLQDTVQQSAQRPARSPFLPTAAAKRRLLQHSGSSRFPVEATRYSV